MPGVVTANGHASHVCFWPLNVSWTPVGSSHLSISFLTFSIPSVSALIQVIVLRVTIQDRLRNGLCSSAETQLAQKPSPPRSW